MGFCSFRLLLLLASRLVLETLANLAVEAVVLRRPQVALRVDTFRPAVVPQAGPPHVNVQRGRFAAPPRAEHAVQRVAERFPEVPIEVRVNQRIQRGVEVADPKHEDDHNVRVGTLVAERCDDVPKTRKGENR